MKYLFYIAQNYAFEILRPLQQEIWAQGGQAAWFIEGNEVNRDYLNKHETLLMSINDVIDFHPDAVFVPGNEVPDFIPGLKVQVFHGFEWKKKGHFRIRGFFDLYCTQGPFFTRKFEQLKQVHPHFNVVETGWPKMDTLFSAEAYRWLNQDPMLKTILYAPTFSPSLTSAMTLFDEIKQLSELRNWQWLIKFHPKMSQEWVEKYRALVGDKVHIVETDTLAPVLQAADVMVSDTSSIITEFAMLNRPIVTFNNSQPEPHLLNIDRVELLGSTIEQALDLHPELLQRIQQNVALLHPYYDGQSSARMLTAVKYVLNQAKSDLKAKPLNWFRAFKLRKKLGYWKL